MNYIISPSWFYWISVADTIRGLSALALAFSICGVFIFSILIAICQNSINEYPSISKGERKRLPIYKNLVKLCLITIPVFAVMVIFVPSKNTLIEMMIAKQATYDNAQWTLETLKSAVDYIVSAIQSMK